MPSFSHLPRAHSPPVKMMHCKGETYSTGIEEAERDGVDFRVSSLAKAVADCLKHLNRIGLNVAIEALNGAQSPRKCPVEDIWRFARCLASPTRYAPD
jgi:hypothetical protein